MRQLIAYLTIPFLCGLLYKYLGLGRNIGYFSLCTGAILLLAISFMVGVYSINSGNSPSECTVEKFLLLSGGISCSPIIVSASYSFILFGAFNVIFKRKE